LGWALAKGLNNTQFLRIQPHVSRKHQ